MKKNIFLLLFIILSTQMVNAQRVKFGIKAGFNSQELSIQKQTSDYPLGLGMYQYYVKNYYIQEREFKTMSLPGYYIGALTEIALDDDLLIETGLIFTQQGTKLESMKVKGFHYKDILFLNEKEYNNTTFYLSDSYIKMSMLNIPVLVKIPVSKNRKWISKIGAEVGCTIFVKEKIEDIAYEYGGHFDFKGGIGGEYVFVSGIFIDSSIFYGLVNMETYPKVKNKMRAQLGIGYKF